MKPPARQLPPRPIPLRPDPAASDEAVMRSLSRAVIASGLAATDRKIDLAVYPRNAWPSDRDVPRILRTAKQHTQQTT
jgi:hypothetical protein